MNTTEKRLAELEQTLDTVEPDVSENNVADKLMRVAVRAGRELIALCRDSRKAAIEELESPIHLIDVHATPGRVDAAWAADPLLAQALIEDLVAFYKEQCGGENYLELTMNSRLTGEGFTVLLQKKGGKTTAEVNAELRSKLEEAERLTNMAIEEVVRGSLGTKSLNATLAQLLSRLLLTITERNPTRLTISLQNQKPMTLTTEERERADKLATKLEEVAEYLRVNPSYTSEYKYEDCTITAQCIRFVLDMQAAGYFRDECARALRIEENTEHV